MSLFHPQTNVQLERYNLMISIRIRHYVTDHQRDWEHYIKPLTYGLYYSKIHRSTGHTPVALCFSRHPQNPIFLAPTSSTASYTPLSTPSSTVTTKLLIFERIRGFSPIRIPTFASPIPTTRSSLTRTWLSKRYFSLVTKSSSISHPFKSNTSCVIHFRHDVRSVSFSTNFYLFPCHYQQSITKICCTIPRHPHHHDNILNRQ